MKIAYVRVSTVEQNEGRQKEELKKYGIDKWYVEKISGKNRDREQLKLMLDFVREGDEIYVEDFSRLSRSVKDLLDIIDELKEKKVRLVSVKENFDINTNTGILMVTMLGSIYEFERACILERQREGIDLAKKQNKYKGRQPMEIEGFDEKVALWREKKISVTKLCRQCHISRATFYARIKKLEEENGKCVERDIPSE